MPAGKHCPVDFDHHSAAYAADPFGQLRIARDQGAVSWSEAYGGFWLVSGHSEAREVARDDRRFSQAKVLDDSGNVVWGGATIPSGGPVSVPFELDPPEHGKYRALFSTVLGRKAVQGLESRIRELVNEVIDEIIESGSADFVMDIADLVPSYLVCELLGLDRDEAPRVATVAHKLIYISRDTPEYAEAQAGWEWLSSRITEAVAERRDTPRDDLISYFAHAQVDDQRVTEQRAKEMIWQFIAGGVDTTGSFTSTVLVHLHAHPEQRAWLCEDLDRVPACLDELLRFFTPAQHAARTVLEPLELGGQQLEAGDRVMISWAGANHDPVKFVHPDVVDLGREVRGHLAFGTGSHTCSGIHLGRLESEVMLTETLRRLPDYRIVQEEVRRYPSIGIMNGFVQVPIIFTPGPRVGPTNGSGALTRGW